METLKAPIATRWVLLGCVVPDLPWVLQRIMASLAPGLDLYDLRLYAIVQSSLLGCLLLCAAFSFLSPRPAVYFGLLALNSAMHLTLDSLQTKWGNGVHFLLPFSWDLQNFGLFWPEHWITFALTASCLLYLALVFRRRRHANPSTGKLRRVRFGVAHGFLLAYLITPLALMSPAEKADNHSVATLRDVQHRTGRSVEFDRNRLSNQDGRMVLHTFADERILLTGNLRAQEGVVSIRGVFSDPGMIRVEDVHIHRVWFRDGASYVGMLLLCGFWLVHAIGPLRFARKT